MTDEKTDSQKKRFYSRNVNIINYKNVMIILMKVLVRGINKNTIIYSGGERGGGDPQVM